MPTKDHSEERAKQFVTQFVALSRRYKQQFDDRHREILNNFTVTPHEESVSVIGNPYRTRSGRRGIVLKDGETHKAVMTYVSALVGSMLGDRRGEYIQAEPVGYEDALSRGPTATKLMRYAFGLPGVYRSMVEGATNLVLFGTSFFEIGWRYEEREMPVRSLEVIAGQEIESFSREIVSAYDDVDIQVIDNRDFFPDPSEYRMERMAGAAKKFRMNALHARAMADSGVYDRGAVEIAIRNAPPDPERDDQDDDTHSDQLEDDKEVNADFRKMVGYEYNGDVPWGESLATSRRRITVLNNVVVRDRKYPFADTDLPYRSMVINPVQGRLFGVSPAEVIRYDQDIQDAMKRLLVEATIKRVHPPMVYNESLELNTSMLNHWSPNQAIPVHGDPSQIQTVQYGADLFGGFQQVAALKQSMQETSGALNVLQGQGIGTKRASATEASFSQQAALGRPEFAAALLEREFMPCIARSILRRYQQFLQDTDDLKDRVGQLPDPHWLGDIMGDFDIKFTGSRQANNRQEQLQSWDRLIAAAAALPELRAQLPWQLLGRDFVGDTLELPDVAASMGDPDVIRKNIMLQTISQATQAQNENGAVQSSEPAGALPAQTGGTDLA